jgi:hypothetical protein
MWQMEVLSSPLSQSRVMFGPFLIQPVKFASKVIHISQGWGGEPGDADEPIRAGSK